MRTSRCIALLANALSLLAFPGCRESPVVSEHVAPPQAPKPPPVDRLAEGELAAGKQAVFGFVPPRDLQLDAVFPDSAYFSGQIDPLVLASYVKARVASLNPEVTPTRTTFERARILGGAPTRVYRIEILSPNRLKTTLVLKDITPPPSVKGLNETERWRRAGLTPTGQLLDPLKQE